MPPSGSVFRGRPISIDILEVVQNWNLFKPYFVQVDITTGSISRCRFSEIIQISMKTFIAIDQDEWKRSLSLSLLEIIQISMTTFIAINQDNLKRSLPLPLSLSLLEIIQMSMKTFITTDQDKWKRSPARSAGSRHGP